MKTIRNATQFRPGGAYAPANTHCIACFVLGTLILVVCAVAGCGKKEAPAPPPEQSAKPTTADSSLVSGEFASSASQGTLVLPAGFGKRTGDLDEMAKSRA